MFRKYVYLHPSVGENKDGMDYEMMTNGAVPVKHQYINVDRRGKRDQQSPNLRDKSYQCVPCKYIRHPSLSVRSNHL